MGSTGSRDQNGIEYPQGMLIILNGERDEKKNELVTKASSIFCFTPDLGWNKTLSFKVCERSACVLLERISLIRFTGTQTHFRVDKKTRLVSDIS